MLSCPASNLQNIHALESRGYPGEAEVQAIESCRLEVLLKRLKEEHIIEIVLICQN